MNLRCSISLAAFIAFFPACDSGGDDPGGGSAGKGGSSAAGTGGGGRGGSGGSGQSSGGSGGGGTSGSSGGGSGGGQAGAGGAGQGGRPGSGGSGGGDASASDTSPGQGRAGDGPSAGPVGPSAPGQGPVAQGKIAYSQDFELNMDGMSRSPNNLPEDRIQIIDDPTGQRGKIVKIEYREGDNFRTSSGTQPRSWFSAAMGYTVKPGTKVSLAWGFMWQNVNMNAHFAQIIRDGGPIWMWDVDGGGTVSMTFHRGSGRTGPIMKLEPMKWYDFMVVTDYKEGGECQFFLNGKMVGTGRSVGGANARFDFGTYWRPGAHPARTVYVSNVSIGEL